MNGSGDELPRRPFLGIGVRETARGLVVTQVVAGSMGAQAGLSEGDELIAVGGRALDSMTALLDQLRAIRGARVSLRLRRDAQERELEVDVVPYPRESFDGAETRYGHTETELGRLRTLRTAPPGGPHPAVLFLPGIACASVEVPLTPEAPLARLIAAWTSAGFATLRVERSGLGDSEGPPCSSVGFSDELDAYITAARAMLTDPAIDRDRLFVFGHSIGGVHAPFVCATLRPRGVMVYGTSARRWSSCLREGLIRQLRLRGASDAIVAERSARFDADPFADLHGRARRFHEELEALDVEGAWRRVECPALVVIGEHDWVVSAEEQRAIAALVPGAEVLELDGLDHAFTTHASFGASLEALGAGTFDARLATETARFMRACALVRRPPVRA